MKAIFPFIAGVLRVGRTSHARFPGFRSQGRRLGQSLARFRCAGRAFRKQGETGKKVMRTSIVLVLVAAFLRDSAVGAEAPSPAPSVVLAAALAREDLSAVRAAVAAERELLGSRAGEPEVPDEFQPVPKDGKLLTRAEAMRGFTPHFAALDRLRWWKVGVDPTTLTAPLRGPASVIAGNVAATCQAGRGRAESGHRERCGGVPPLGATAGGQRRISVSGGSRDVHRTGDGSGDAFSGEGGEGRKTRSGGPQRLGLRRSGRRRAAVRQRRVRRGHVRTV